MTSSDALPDLPTAEDVQRALDEGEPTSMTEVLGVLTGQVPVKSGPIAMNQRNDDDTSES